MFLEKFSRFFRSYELRFVPRHKGAPYLPLVGDPDTYNVMDALKRQISAEEALEVLPNGDIIELMEVEYIQRDEALVMLFHRASPNAAEPAYRKKARAKAKKKFTIRTVVKEEGEEQSVSAHLVIVNKTVALGAYPAALEEIPGISLSAIRRIIAKALYDYPYDFERKDKTEQTYTVFKAEGIKAETLTNALKRGEADFITLVRPAKPDFVDADGLFEPQKETMRIRINAKLSPTNWRNLIPSLARKAREAGWDEVNIDLNLDDSRRRTVKVERGEEAKEILFVRSEQKDFKKELQVCSIDISNEVVKKALEIIKS